MSQPTAYDRQVSFSLFSSENPDTSHSGADLDIEFNAVKLSLDETQSNLALIQDDDGALARGSVGRSQLDASITLGFGAPAPWEADTVYDADESTAFYLSKFYITTTTHTSGASFDATKFEEIADFTVANTIDDGSIIAAKLGDSAVETAKLNNLAVTAAKIATNAVTTTKILDANVTTAKIADEAVTSAKVDGSVWGAGDVKLTYKTAADIGWLMLNDGTMGDATSGAGYANVDAEDLFTVLFNNLVDANAAILTSAGGATTRAAQTNAATAWAAHCRMTLPKALGRAFAMAGAGASLTSRALGVVGVGAETKTLTTANLPAYTPAGTNTAPAITVTGGGSLTEASAGSKWAGGGTEGVNKSVTAALANAPVFAGAAQGGTSTAFEIMQPTTFLNAMIKK